MLHSTTLSAGGTRPSPSESPHVGAQTATHPASPLPPSLILSEMTLDDLLQARRGDLCSAQLLKRTLMSESTVAGRELRDGCRIADRGDEQRMVRTFATLLCTPAHRRTLDQLADAGIFITPSRRCRLSPENARVLFSDEGLLLWLRFAASPSAYRDVFVDPILTASGSPAVERAGSRTDNRANNPADGNSHNERLATALRVLVACGRDTTNDVPASERSDSMHLPLSHLCSRVAPEWLPTLLAFGSNINQTTYRGVSLLTTAMAAQAFRAKRHDLDLLVPHDCLYALALSLRNRGASLTHRSDSGSPPAMLLALNGLCGAAEVLFSLGASCNAPDRNGNTLMHYLAAATRTPGHAFCAFFMFTIALRYGGDPNLPNGDDRTALSLLRGSLRIYADALRKMIVATRETARLTITREEHLRHANLSPVTTAMMEEARRLHARGWDPLLPHASLFTRAISLRASGVDLTQRHPDGMPPVLWLTHHGFCGAAEVLLALSRNSNTPFQNGNTLLHLLAAARRHGKTSFLADHMLYTALRYGGDPTQPNAAGLPALASLPADMTRFLRAGLAFHRGTALQAGRAVSRLYPVNTHFDFDLMRHSAADL